MESEGSVRIETDDLSRDAVLKPIIERYPEVRLRLKKDAFTTLARAIAGQQISVKAADSIWARVVAAAKGKPAKIDPTRIYRLSVQELRACGLSERKALYLQNLAEHFIAKKISAGQLARMAGTSYGTTRLTGPPHE